MNKDKAKKMNEELREVLKAFGEKHGGMRVSKGSARYDDKTLRVTVEWTETTKDEEATIKTLNEREVYKVGHRRFDLKAEWLDKAFEHGGRKYTVAGLNLRAVKRPVIAKRDDGKTFVFDAETVKAAFGRKDQVPDHVCEDNPVPYKSDGPLGHGFECGICGKFLQAG